MTKLDNAHRFKFLSMTVPCDITLIDANKQRAETTAKRIYERTRQLEKKYNFHAADSWLNQCINSRNRPSVKIDKECAAILRSVRDISEDCHGLFDISIGTLLRASRNAPDLTRQQLLDALSEAMGCDSWQLDKTQLTFSDPRTCLDLGGVVKEFAVDQASQIACENCQGSIIDFGGDMRINGRRSDGERFTVGVRDPHQKDKTKVTLALEDVAITTSGHYERSTTMGNKQESHVLSSRNNISSNLASATVISDSALTCGVYSTSLLLDDSLPLQNKAKVLLINQQGQIYSNLDQTA